VVWTTFDCSAARNGSNNERSHQTAKQ